MLWTKQLRNLRFTVVMLGVRLPDSGRGAMVIGIPLHACCRRHFESETTLRLFSPLLLITRNQSVAARHAEERHCQNPMRYTTISSGQKEL